MFRYRREMYALQLKYVYTALLILASIGLNEAIANGRNRRRYGPAVNAAASSSSTTSNKKSADLVTEKSKTDQMVAAATHTESNQYRRGGAYSTDAGDYSYNNADINLIRPESKPLHTKITAKYTSSISIPADSLEDSETAEEYVAKAMGIYGSRLREPIRIPSETEASQAEQPQPLPQPQQLQHTRHHPTQSTQEQQQLQNLHEAQEKPDNFEYYPYTKKDVQGTAASADESESNQSSQYHYAAQLQAENEAAKAMLEAQMQAQLQEQMQQAHYLANKETEESPQQTEQQNEEASVKHHAAPVYEKDPVTRSYNIYEEHTEGYEAAQPLVDRTYRTKYLYKPVSATYHSGGSENEEKIRVSASTEIPKAEIMKQIEKSVIRYMKELEAEGKIIAAPQNQEAKTYFKVISVPGSDEKRIASTTLKPKYSPATSNYPENYKHAHSHSAEFSSSNNNYADNYKHGHGHASTSSSASNSNAGSSKYHKNSGPKSYVLENESSYTNSAHDVSESLAPNVEFIYKIKTKAPLHTATVKTVSKPYSLPVKSSYDQFDHSTALKNLEDFDLSHVVTTPDPDDHQSISSASTNKPSKLYFNSEIYHDINSMPYKQKQRVEAEFRKLKQSSEPHPDYKGYGGSNSGYYAEPPTNDGERDMSSSGMSEDGYPLMNPYQFVLKKESIPSKYDDVSGSYEQPRSHKYKSIEYDSYSPKFNNNPESYGYQQTYKTHLTRSHAPGKRGKRGGAPHPSLAKKSPHRSSSMKEYEANVALRPPPKI